MNEERLVHVAATELQQLLSQSTNKWSKWFYKRLHCRGSGRFNSIRQVAPVCPPMWAHWRHLANTIERVLPSVHPSPQTKRQIDRFSCFCTAHGRKSLYVTLGDPFP